MEDADRVFESENEQGGARASNRRVMVGSVTMDLQDSCAVEERECGRKSRKRYKR